MRKSPRIRREKQRRGIAVTELAVCMPVLVLIILATVEACTMIFLQQSLSIAAYEGARVGLVPETESSNIQYQSELILLDRKVKNATVLVTPSDIPGSSEGTWIQVQASAPFSDNSMIGGWLFNSRVLTANVEMMKEH